MTYSRIEYTLYNGKKISVIYDDNDICRVTKKCIEMFIGLYQQGRAEAIDDFTKRLKAKCRKCYVDCDPYGSGIEEDSILYEDDIDEIAEELKAGVKNEPRRIS